MQLNKYIFLICAVSVCVNSDFLENIKETLSSTKKILNEGFGHLKNVVEKIENVQDFIDRAIDEECEPFTCKNGYEVVPDENYVSHSNGCGTYGFEWKRNQLSNENLEECCHEHDLCYGTCGSDRDYCDLLFKKCLYETCKLYTAHAPIDYKGCKATAKLLYTATIALGCKPYKDAQREACTCQWSRKGYEEL
ncbi:group XIIA secretory phospholipase A2-like [Artemia franciscana]|uniref:group XIIA secretory phospholipase A2-like n=1 Tax=Artemia franciscana TaxID=6661 RepID=UPI0032DB4492